MSGTVQLAIIIICCVAGYAAMSFLIDALRRSSREAPPRASYRKPAAPDSDAVPDNDIARARLLLGVNSDATLDQLKLRYRELLSQYHPDKTQHLGIELQELAANKTRQIIEAYELLVSARR
jgi:DnaJ-domain-containing protein 1